MIQYPLNEEELQKREAIGVIRASRFVRRYAQSHKEITIDVICKVHYEIFKDAWNNIAGKFRKEELTITGSDLHLPHSSKVPFLMNELDAELKLKIIELKECEGKILNISYDISDDVVRSIEKVINLSAWIHHKITAIHPFRDGNGRTARLVGNLILERYGLVGISVKIENENKKQYRSALAQIDKCNDYEPLESILSEGILERYNGISMKYYA